MENDESHYKIIMFDHPLFSGNNVALLVSQDLGSPCIKLRSWIMVPLSPSRQNTLLDPQAKL